jgi:hypothetical protein
MTIRLATPADAATVAWLGRLTFDETFAHLFPMRSELEAYYEQNWLAAIFL